MNACKINVLIVEDGARISRLFNQMIDTDPAIKSFNIETAENLKDCFSTVKAGNADIVLLDPALSEMTGPETIERFHKTLPDTPLIVLTANSQETMEIESVTKGASAFLEKCDLKCKDVARTILHSLERHEIQQQLKIEKQNAQNYLDLAGVIVVLIDTDQKISMINKTGCRLLGYCDDELLSMNWFDTFSPSENRENLKEKFDRTIAEGKQTPRQFETSLVTAGGDHKIISWNRKFIRDKNGNITGVLGSGTDITTQKISKRNLKEINNLIIDHDIQKSVFIVNVSHELRTPLAIFKSIISNAIAGTSGKITAKLEKELLIGDKVIDRLAGIITDFLDISKIVAGKMKLNLDSIDICKLVTEAIETHKPLIESNNMQVNVLIPDESIIFEADYQKMDQVLGELIENAVKFVPNCGGKMIIRVTDLDDKIGIDIEDNGPGIEDEDINRVFKRFIQVERHVGEGDHGTGLGLAITKELVEMHNGSIRVENKKNGGTIFKMIIPKKPPISQTEESQSMSEIEKNIDSLADQANQIAEICTECSTPVNDDTSPGNSAPIVDWNLAIKYCGDETVVKRIANSVLTDAPMQMKSLIEAVKNRNVKDAVYFSHKLKGSILTIGATELPDKAEIVEIAAGKNDFDTVNANMPQLLKEYDRFIEFISKEDWTTIARQAI